MKFAFHCLTLAVALLAAGCGTSSSTVTGPSLDRCGITVVNSMSSVGASGGTGRLAVTAGRECTWSMTSNVPWITARQPANGQGDGSVEYVVAANTNPDSRRGTVVVGGQVFEVVQEGLACQFELRPNSRSVEAEGGNGNFAVEGADGCNWTPTASDEWITITNGGSRTGSDSVNFTVARNTGAARNGAIRVGGQSFSISQSAPQCRYQLSPITTSVSGAGGSGAVTVTAAGTCAWTATSSVPWISIVGAANGTGNGSVSFTVQPNPGAARNGILNIGGQRFTVTQQQAECNYSIAPAGQSFATAGGQGSVTVSTASVCTWNTSDVPAWVAGMPPSGTGTQAIAFTVEPNAGPARTAVIIIAGQSFTVSQSGGCTYSLAPGSHTASASGGASSVDVNTAAGCEWTSSGAPAWVTGIPATGTGPQTINFMVAANSGVARSANISIAGQTFVVNQGIGCSFSLAPTGYSPSAAGGSSSFAVNTAAGCGWTSSGVPAWITGVPANGTGPQTINFTVAANPNPAPRSANIVIGGQTFSVTQAAFACTYSLNPTSHSATAAGGSSSFDVTTTSACAWTSSGVPGWITGVPANGTGTTTINFTVAANSDPTPRTANITIGGQTFSVTQAALACSYSLNPTSHSASASGGSSSFDVNTTASCGWTSSGVPSWITGVPANGTGTTTINFTVAANPDPTSRSANIIVGGQTFMVSQAAASCSYSLNPTSHNASAAGGSSSFDVNTTASCGWTSSSVPSWITGVPANGTGTTTINFTVAANPDPTPRTANISIGGQTFTVSQAAASCSYSLNPTSHNASASGGSSSFDVNTTASCGWTSSGVPAWITGVPGSGTGTTTINFTVAANTGPARNASIVIEGQTFSVSQANGCTYNAAPGSLTFAASGTPAQDITITAGAGCTWTAVPDQSWIHIVSGGSGPGNGTISVDLLVNMDGVVRQGNIAVGGQTVTITQNP